jgi:uncharacterized protein (TIGR00369 family)
MGSRLGEGKLMSTMINSIRKMMESGEPIMPIAGLLGLNIKSVQSGYSEVEMEMTGDHANTMGTLHGGIYCALADTAMGVAFATMLGEGETLTTLELKINYLKPVWNGKVVAKGKVVKKGRMTGLVECDVLDENAQLVARASSTFMAISGEQARNRTLPA